MVTFRLGEYKRNKAYFKDTVIFTPKEYPEGQWLFIMDDNEIVDVIKPDNWIWKRIVRKGSEYCIADTDIKVNTAGNFEVKVIAKMLEYKDKALYIIDNRNFIRDVGKDEVCCVIRKAYENCRHLIGVDRFKAMCGYLTDVNVYGVGTFESILDSNKGSYDLYGMSVVDDYPPLKECIGDKYVILAKNSEPKAAIKPSRYPMQVTLCSEFSFYGDTIVITDRPIKPHTTFKTTLIPVFGDVALIEVNDVVASGDSTCKARIDTVVSDCFTFQPFNLYPALIKSLHDYIICVEGTVISVDKDTCKFDVCGVEYVNYSATGLSVGDIRYVILYRGNIVDVLSPNDTCGSVNITSCCTWVDDCLIVTSRSIIAGNVKYPISKHISAEVILLSDTAVQEGVSTSGVCKATIDKLFTDDDYKFKVISALNSISNYLPESVRVSDDLLLHVISLAEKSIK